MTAKEYLSQAYVVDQHIKRMIRQARSLRDLTENTSQVLSDMPHSPSRSTTQLEDVIIRIADLDDKIIASENRLVLLKKELGNAISQVDNQTYELLLNLRYLCFMPWPEIAPILGYDLRYTYKLHIKALQKVDSQGHYKTLETQKKIL